MEGASRPGHFDGVGTVVEELFRQIQPNQAYFGEKDFQQLAIIKKLVEKLNLPIKIHGVPIFRAENGLAMSSRNERLSPEMKERAKIIYETLVEIKKLFSNTPITELYKKVENQFQQEDRMTLEYFIIADEETLKEATYIQKGKKYRAFIVVVVDGIRLIDNMALS